MADPPVGEVGPAPADRRDRGALRALAGLDLRDGLQARRALVLRALTPVVMALAVLGVSLAARGGQPGTGRAYRVAVQGDLAGARATLDDLAPGQLQFEATDDAAVAAARGADVGLVVPDGLDARVQAGQPTEVQLLTSATAPASRSAAARIREAFASRWGDAVRAARQATGPPRFTLDVVNVQRTATGTRLLVAGLTAALLVLQASTLTGAVATRFLGRRGRGLFATQLLLPLPRRRVALAKGGAELGLGLLVSTPVLLTMVLLVALSVRGRDGPAASVASVAFVLAASVALSAFMTALGLVLGAVARSQEQVTLASGLVVILAASASALVALGDTPRPAGLSLVPVVGVVASLREVLDANWGVGWLVAALVSTAIATSILVRVAGRHFDAERLVLRG